MKLTKAQRKALQVEAVQAAYDTLLRVYSYTPVPREGKHKISVALDLLATAFPNDEIKA